MSWFGFDWTKCSWGYGSYTTQWGDFNYQIGASDGCYTSTHNDEGCVTIKSGGWAGGAFGTELEGGKINIYGVDINNIGAGKGVQVYYLDENNCVIEPTYEQHDGYVTVTAPDNFCKFIVKNYTNCDIKIGELQCDPVNDSDGIVEGTPAGDLIDLAYTGDPDGDMIDNNDAILAGEYGNDDIVKAGAGDDTVLAGEGNDEVYGGTGSDTLYGGAGNDYLKGDEGDAAGTNTDTSVDWGDFARNSSGHVTSGATQDIGGVNVTFSFNGQQVGSSATYTNQNEYVEAGDNLDSNSALFLYGPDKDTCNTGSTEYTFNAWDLNDVTASSSKIFQSGAVGSDYAVGKTFTINSGASVKDITVSDNDGYLNDNDDSDQKLVGSEHLEGTTYSSGSKVQPEYAYTVKDCVTGEYTNIYAIQMPDSDTVALASDKAMIPGHQYQVVSCPENLPSIGYSQLDGYSVSTDAVGDVSTATLDFSSADSAYSGEVENVSFRINDIDYGPNGEYHRDIVTVRAYDANGNEVAVTITPEGNQTVNGNTVTGGDIDNGGTLTPTSAAGSVLFEIDGPVSKIVIDYDNGGYSDQAINVTDLNVTTIALDTGVAGDDVIYGDEGDDWIEGDAGNDKLYGGTGNDYLNGGDGDDRLEGGDGNDYFVGGAGNDQINGGDGDDYLDDVVGTDQDGAGYDYFVGGAGNDTAYLGLDHDRAYGGTGNDKLYGEGGHDALFGDEGDDQLYGGEGTDAIQGGSGNDIAYGGSGEDNINGGAGNDTLFGDDGNDHIVGLDGDDSLYGGAGNDTFLGGRGADVMFGGEGADNFYGGDDADYIYGTAGDFVDGDAGGDDNDTLDLTGQGKFYLDNLSVDSNGNGFDGTVRFVDDNGVETGQTIDFTEIESFKGDIYNRGPIANDDFATTAFQTPVIIDLLANDIDPDGDPLTLVSVTSDDGLVVPLGDGKVLFTPLNGFFGPATMNYTVSDGQQTDNGTARIQVEEQQRDGTVMGTAGDDVIDVSYAGDPDGDFVDNDDAILAGDTGNDDLIYGYGGNDSILAGDGNDEVYGGAGNDYIDGGVGDDIITGGEGNDTIVAGQGNDEVYGGNGDDSVQGGAGNDNIYGGGGNDTLRGGDGNDSLYGGQDDDYIIGGDGDDYVNGNGGFDTLDGALGNDRIIGGEEEDVLIGGAGNDTLYGQGADDSLIGNTGSDEIYGGKGDDIIDASSQDPYALPDIGYPGLYPSDTDPNNDRDYVDGGEGNDTIFTGDDADTIRGGTGDDHLDGGIDADEIWGDEGNDYIIGGEGDDVLYGGDGDDFIAGGLGPNFPDSINQPNDGTDLVLNNGRDDISAGAGNDTVYGQDDDDTIRGGEGDDYLDGGIDDDIIWGNEGSDTIVGGDGVDTLYGGLNSDTFIGGNVGDYVEGGEDPDNSDVDVLDLTGVSFDRIVYDNGNPEAGTVYFDANDDTQTMRFEQIENVIPCFTPGTLIATARGQVLVENLREGDKVITRDNGIQEIAWVGSKLMTTKDLVAAPHMRPVLIKAGALGNGLPERDMMVSPNHRLLVASDVAELYFEEREVLAAAKHLVGSQGIHQIDVANTNYIHFMFERHEVVLSDGAWTESFQPGDYSLKGIGKEQRNEIFELFPELREKVGVENYQSARKSLKKHEAKLLVR